MTRATKKAMKPPLLFDTISLFPLFSIAVFSLFVLWQWSSPPPFNPSFASDRPVTYPRDQAATFSTIALPNNHPDASSHVLADPDKSIRIHDVVIEEGKCCRCGTEELLRAEKEARAGGASLLHKWNDEELYGRVIGADLRRISRTWADEDCSSVAAADDSSSSLGGTRHRLRSGSSESCSSYCAQKHSSDPLATTGKVKIAFLFMITTSLPFEPLWSKFFQGNEGFYNIYVHPDPFNSTLFNQTSGGVFWDRLIPSRKAFRGSPSLVLASNRLVANAMLDDPSNGYFALLSGQCIPVRSFHHVYQIITASQRSFVEQIWNESIMWERYTGRGGESIMQSEIPFAQFRKAAQWFVFTRRHALMVLQDVQDRKYWGKFDHECRIYFCGTDEHYYPTLLHILDPGGVTNTTVTYVHWPDYVTEHPSTFGRHQIKRRFIMDIQEKDGGQYLFARKFEPDTLDLLMNINDTILR